jgi:hypothetical protein
MHHEPLASQAWQPSLTGQDRNETTPQQLSNSFSFNFHGGLPSGHTMANIGSPHTAPDLLFL